MKLASNILLLVFTVTLVTALPVTKKKKEDKQESTDKPTGAENIENTLEYERYLKEVVEALESDPEFRKKLDKAPEADIRSGKIAQELDYVNHHVRSKLDEIKRREIDRLRMMATKQYELSNDIDREHMKVPLHLDHDNEHTFEIDDLKKLILKTSEDLAEADKQRREEFKQYEMQKEFEKQAVMKEMDDEHKKKFEEELKEQKEKHNAHQKVHHPGNKAQLEEVWEQQDHMDKGDFNPKTFFMLHDLDSNGVWDEQEVKALFVKELDKVYQSGIPEDDMRERAEEMERMREHVFKETDTNHDGLISFQEFIDQTKREEFNTDPNWDTVDNEPQYTHDEYLEFERRRQEEVQRMVAQGLLPPHPNMPHGYYPNSNAGYQVNHQQGLGGQQQMHYQGQPPQQYHPEAVQHQQQQYQQAGQPVQLHPNQAYQQVQQQQQAGQPVQLHPNQAYQQVQQQQQHYQQQQQQQYQQQQQQQYQQQQHQQYQQQMPVQQQVPAQQQQRVPVQQQHQQTVNQQPAQGQPMQQQQQVPVQQQQQVPVQQQQQVPVQQQQQVPVQQQQQVPVQQQQQVPVQQQQQVPAQQQNVPVQQQQQVPVQKQVPAQQQQQVPVQQAVPAQQQQQIPPQQQARG